MKASSVALPVAFVVIAVAIPIQHCASLRAHEEEVRRPYRNLPPTHQLTSGPTHSEYPNGTRPEYTYRSGILAGSRLIDTSSEELLQEVSYRSELIDGRVLPVISKITDYTLWGRAKWYALGIAAVCAVLSLMMLVVDRKRDQPPAEQ